MAYDYGKTASARRNAPAQGKHARSGARAMPRGRHASIGKTATKIVPPPAKPAVAVAQKRQQRRAARKAPRLLRTDKRQSSPFTKVTNRSPALMAEFLFGVAVISISIFTESRDRGYNTVMAEVMMRLSGLTALFFILFLFTGSKRGGEFAMWFGLLIDIAVAFRALQKNNFTRLASGLSGQGIPSETGGTQLAADITEKPTEIHETPGLENPNG